MIPLKNTQRSVVSMSFDGRVAKSYLGPNATERFRNEVRVLKYLEERNCPFVPRLIAADDEELKLWMSSCGLPVLQLSEDRCQRLFRELEEFGVLHEDQHRRNVTYRASDGRFCVIDFEYAQILGENPANSISDELDQLIDLIANELK